MNVNPVIVVRNNLRGRQLEKSRPNHVCELCGDTIHLKPRKPGKQPGRKLGELWDKRGLFVYSFTDIEAKTIGKKLEWNVRNGKEGCSNLSEIIALPFEFISIRKTPLSRGQVIFTVSPAVHLNTKYAVPLHCGVQVLPEGFLCLQSNAIKHVKI